MYLVKCPKPGQFFFKIVYKEPLCYFLYLSSIHFLSLLLKMFRFMNHVNAII